MRESFSSNKLEQFFARCSKINSLEIRVIEEMFDDGEMSDFEQILRPSSMIVGQLVISEHTEYTCMKDSFMCVCCFVSGNDI